MHSRICICTGRIAAAFCVLCCAFVVGAAQGDSALPELYVFCPLPLRPQAVEAKLNDVCPDVRVVVFGRRKDFVARVQSSAPAGVLANPLLVAGLAGYRQVLRGTREQSTREPYVLVRIHTDDRKTQAPPNTVGMVELLERTRTEAIVDSLLGSGKSVKRVAKVEDLLPLLRFGIAEMVFVPTRHYRNLRETSQLSFQVKRVPGASMGVVSLAVREGAGVDDLPAILRDGGETVLDVLELDGWR